MPFCAYCAAATAVVSFKPCPNCGNPANGALRPPLATGGTNAIAIVIVVAVGALFVTAFIGILAAIAIPNLLTATQRSKQKRTMSDLRDIGRATDAYFAVNNGYPRVQSFDELRPMLQPQFAKTLPVVDSWGHPFRYECIGDGELCRNYAIASAGKDGLFEHDKLADYGPAETTRFDCDIIFANGTFLQYPGENGPGGR